VASARAIVAGSGIGFALRADGTVAGWGSDSAGQLGNGGPAVTSRRGPVTVSGLTHVRAIAAGDAGYAVLGDGTVSAWGVNTRGQLGDGASTSTDLPVSVTGLHDVIAISASGGAAVAIVRAG
jgi:alpha-tubulin suppressor-like RCC1 family protein